METTTTGWRCPCCQHTYNSIPATIIDAHASELGGLVLRFRIRRFDDTVRDYGDNGITYGADLFAANGNILVYQFKHGYADTDDLKDDLNRFAAALGAVAQFEEPQP